MMVGGDAAAYKQIEPFIKDLTEPGGHAHVGPSGAGHFVKMVHNGIEYGMMQSIAEGFEIMQASEFSPNLHKVAALWQHGSVVRSWLLDLLVLALEEDKNLEKIRGYVEDSGEGRWTVFEAIDESVPAPAITLSLFARFASRQDESFAAKVNAALRNQFGGHAVKTVETTKAQGREPSDENPLRDGLRLPRTPDPCALVVFGASGDLTRRKLFPAIYSLAARNLLPERFALVGVARTALTDAEFRALMKEAVREHGRDEFDEKVWKRLARAMHYCASDVSMGGGEVKLFELLARLDRQRGTAGNRVFYLAVPPSAFTDRWSTASATTATSGAAGRG